MPAIKEKYCGWLLAPLNYRDHVRAVYHGTKAYVLSFTKALMQELKDSAVTITALQPAATRTDFFNKAEMQESKILDTKLSDPAKVRRTGTKH